MVIIINKRFIDSGIEEIENQHFIDLLEDKAYWVDDGLEDILELLNNLFEENNKLKIMLELIKEKYNQNGYINEDMLNFDKCDIEYPYKFVNRANDLVNIYNKNYNGWFNDK